MMNESQFIMNTCDIGPAAVFGLKLCLLEQFVQNQAENHKHSFSQ